MNQHPHAPAAPLAVLESRSLALVCWLRELRRRAEDVTPAWLVSLPPSSVYLNELPRALREFADALDGVRQRLGAAE